jgi:hypothetical protein
MRQWALWGKVVHWLHFSDEGRPIDFYRHSVQVLWVLVPYVPGTSTGLGYSSLHVANEIQTTALQMTWFLLHREKIYCVDVTWLCVFAYSTVTIPVGTVTTARSVFYGWRPHVHFLWFHGTKKGAIGARLCDIRSPRTPRSLFRAWSGLTVPRPITDSQPRQGSCPDSRGWGVGKVLPKERERKRMEQAHSSWNRNCSIINERLSGVADSKTLYVTHNDMTWVRAPPYSIHSNKF